MNLRIVLYCAVRRRLIASYTWRTVAGPILQSTARISSSASVGRGSLPGIKYEDITSKCFVCQAISVHLPHSSRRGRTRRRSFLRRQLSSCPFCGAAQLPRLDNPLSSLSVVVTRFSTQYRRVARRCCFARLHHWQRVTARSASRWSNETIQGEWDRL